VSHCLFASVVAHGVSVHSEHFRVVIPNTVTKLYI
jgi:hypothetical protein